MRKYAYATLCGTLLFSGKAAFAIETSLLDRLARSASSATDRPAPGLSRSLTARRAASPAPSANAELVGQLRRANEQLQELEQKLAATEQGNALLTEQLAQRQAKGAARRNPAPWPPSRNRIRPASANWASGEDTQAQRDALAAELASARTATAGNASQDSALSAAWARPAPRSPA